MNNFYLMDYAIFIVIQLLMFYLIFYYNFFIIWIQLKYKHCW